MHISVDHSKRIKVCNSRGQLPEDAESVEQAHLCLAELLPSAYVIWALTPKSKCLNIVKHHGLCCELQKVSVVGFFELINQGVHHLGVW